MSKTIVKLSGCRSEGRKVDGEYDGGSSMVSARKKARFFAEHCPVGKISICKVTRDWDLNVVEVYRDR